MNIKNIIKAVHSDAMNWQLCTICAELNNQGIFVRVEGV